MPRKRAAYGSFIFRPTGSSRWWFRYQYPKEVQHRLGRKVEFALKDEFGNRITDERLAHTVKLSHIEEHRRKVWAVRNEQGYAINGYFCRRMWVAGLRWRYPLGESTLEDGTRVLATESKAILFRDGIVIREAENEEVPKLTYDFVPKPDTPIRKPDPPLLKDDDSMIIERYLKKRKFLDAEGRIINDSDGDAKGLRRTLADLKTVTQGRALNEVLPSDIEKLVTHLRVTHGVRKGRIQKLFALMRAACNLEFKADHPRLTRNPFASFEIEHRPGDEKRDYAPYSEGDVALIKANIHLFTNEERLLVIWHIASGVRPGGLHSIRADGWEEAEVKGKIIRTRYVQIEADKDEKGADTFYGRRCLPIPQAVLDSGLLPERIDGPLWKRRCDQMLVMINRKLARIGVNKDGKTFYSARHRVRDRWRDMDPEPSERMTTAIMGHAREMKPHERYGHGFKMWKLKPVVDAVGF